MTDDVFTRHVPELSKRDQRLVRAYQEMNIPTDRLIDSPKLDELADRLANDGDDRSPQEILQRLITLRKAGLLPRLTRLSHRVRKVSDRDNAIEVTDASSIEHLKELVGKIANDGRGPIRITGQKGGPWKVRAPRSS